MFTKTLICKGCGKPFEISSYRKSQKYCNHSCYLLHSFGENAPNWKGGDTPKICPACGKIFYWNHHKPENIYCSTACSMEYMRGELAPHWSGGPREYKCLYCGKVFIKKNNRKKMLKYCSSKCAGFARTGENNPLWNGGTSFTEYPKAFDKAFKGMIRQRDNYTCAICKQPGKDVHHINYIKMDTTPRNCITLCHSCHNRTNSHREYWQSILTN